MWWKVAAVLSALCATTAATANAPSERRLVDRDGLEFVSQEAFCALHCTSWRRNSELTQCDADKCPEYLTATPADQRRLADQETANAQGSVHSASDNDDVEAVDASKVSVLTCGDGEASVKFDIDAASTENVFRGFYDAFFQAFNAMIMSANASMEACQLQWLQEELLPNATADNSTASSSAAVNRPTLVRFDTQADQRACATQIKAIWSDDDEKVTPFVSRLGQSDASATVMLVHVNASVVAEFSNLDCVSSVVELPSILKLLPFARSASQLSNRNMSGAPAMWVRVVKGSDPQTVATRLQTKLLTKYGVTNVFEMPERADLFPRGVFIKAVPQLELWSHAVALAVADAEVEWVDAKNEMSLHGIRGQAYKYAPQRRLDDYVESLVGVEPAQQQGIRGDGVIVGITDTGLYIDHDQFDQSSRAIYGQVDKSARKVVYYNPWADRYDQGEDITCGHGTHVSGLLAGSSLSGSNTNIGIASSARIAFMDIGTQSASCAGEQGCAVSLATPADASQLLKSQMDVGAKIFSFSWGTPGSDYSSQARDLDEFIYENPDILIVIAAGNSGEDSSNGQGTISSPSGAKNVISVGASLNSADSFASYGCPSVFNPDSVASFSSAGPTTDGRLKPDVVAPGMTLVSSRSEAPGSTTKSSATCSLQGTSQATPVVTGIAVLLYQWLRDGYWKAGKNDTQYAMTSVPAALLKALIIHSGDSLQRRLAKFPSGPVSCSGLQSQAWGLTYPDVYQGYGKPNMSNIADFSSSDATPTLYFLPNSTDGSEPAVANGKEVRISFTVPRGVDLRATIVWTDPPGSIRATTQLQHDLDLSVQVRNTTQMFYPLTADNSTKRDAKNNVEMVQVSYTQLLAALNAEANASSLLGPNGEIVVDAIVYGRSVLLADSQAFAFVASSSVIGSTSGSAKKDSTASNSVLSKSFWSPWMIGAVAGGAVLLLLIISSCVGCCSSKRHRRPPAAGAPVVMMHPVGGAPVGYHPYTTPAHGNRTGLETCPYCTFAASDPVLMVNHVENMHTGGGGAQSYPAVVGGAATPSFGLPPTVNATSMPPPYHQQQQAPPAYSQYPMYQQPPQGQDERCPFCSFVSADAVILVNHVENFHGEQRMV